MTDSFPTPRPPSEKSRGVATALAALLGIFGAHRFYLGKPESGALMLLTIGGLGIWWLYDLILVASGSFRDGERAAGHAVGSRGSLARRAAPPPGLG